MLNRFLLSVGIMPEEQKAFKKLYIHSFFIGLFISFFATVSYSLFLNHFGAKELPLAFLISGVLGYLVIVLYSRIQKKLPARKLYFGILAFLLLLLCGLRGMYFFADSGSFEKTGAFILFIAFAPAQTLILLEFGGLSLQIFDIRQGKRLFALVSTGDIIAAMLGFLSVPLFINFLSSPLDLLYIAIAAVIGCAFILKNIISSFPEHIQNEPSTEETEVKEERFSFFKNKYSGMISLIALFSVITAFFADYLFLGSTKMLPVLNSQVLIAQFISTFFGVVKVGELIMSFLSGRILSQFGMKLGLTLFPIMMTIIVVLAVFAGFFFSEEIMLFFLLVCVSQFIDRVVRKAIDVPAFRTLFQPLSTADKLRLQTRVDGVVNQLGVLVSGLLLILISFVTGDSAQSMLYFSVIFIPFLAFYSISAIRMFKIYREKLQDVLASGNRRKIKATDTDLLTGILAEQNIVEIRKSLALIAETDPGEIEKHAAGLLKTNDRFVQTKVLNNLLPLEYNRKIIETVKSVYERTPYPDVKELCVKVLSRLDYENVAALSKPEIYQLADTGKYSDKLILIKYLSRKPSDADESVWTLLLRDNDPLIKKAAIKLFAGEISGNLMSILSELLMQDEYSKLIVTKLAASGEGILPELDHIFRGEQPETLQFRLIEVYEKINSHKSKAALFRHLSASGREIQLAVLSALNRQKFVAGENEKQYLKQLMSEIIDHVLWTQASMLDLGMNEKAAPVVEALEQEKLFNEAFLFEALKLLEDPNSVNLIQENNIGDRKVFALEITDNFLSEEIKEYLIPLIEDISVSQRLKKLGENFPQRRLDVKERLREIINRDYTRVSLWIKSLALEALSHLTKNEFNELYACLFHRHELMNATAAKIIYAQNLEKGIRYIEEYGMVDKHLFQSGIEALLLPEKIKFLQSLPLFSGIPAKNIIKIAELLRALGFKKNETVEVRDFQPENELCIVKDGALKAGGVVFSGGDLIIDEVNAEIKEGSLVATAETVVLIVSKKQFYRQLSGNEKILQNYLNKRAYHWK